MVILAGLIALGAHASNKNTEDQQRTYDELKQKRINNFNANRTQILNSISTAISEGRYEEALNIISKYSFAADPELISLQKKANSLLISERSEKRRAEILTILEGISPSDYKQNYELYKELVSLTPDDHNYSEKYKYYTTEYMKVKKEAEIEAAQAAARKNKIKSHFSAWDGSHKNLEQWIKKNMNDPESYRHVETLFSDHITYYVVKTTFRGKNKFGGVVKSWVKAEIDLEGNIVSIIETGEN